MPVPVYLQDMAAIESMFASMFNAWMMVVDLRYIISIVTQYVILSTWPRFEKQNPKIPLFQHYTQFAIEVCRGWDDRVDINIFRFDTVDVKF